MIKMKLFGLGGQGVVTAAKTLVRAAVIEESRYAKSLPAYGHERRGAPIFTDVIIDDEEILLSTFVYSPDIVVLFDSLVIQKGMVINAGMKPDTILIANSMKPHMDLFNLGWAKVFYVDAAGIAIRCFHKNIPNTAMLGAIAYAGIVSFPSIEQAIRNTLNKNIVEPNVAAAREAYEKTQTL